MSNTQTLILKNNLDEISRIHAFLQESGSAFSFSREEIFALTLALDEMVTNIISYGYDDDREHDIVVTLSVEGNEIRLVLDDDGIAFDPLVRDEPELDIPLEERKIGGLGIHLVRSFMDGISYSRVEGHNLLLLRKSRTTVDDQHP